MALKDRIEIDYEAAFASANPVGQLHDAVVSELKHRGAHQDDLLASLDEHRLALRDEGREAEADAVIEIMERLVGWCGPNARI